MKKVLLGAVIVVAGLFLLSASNVLAQGETGDCFGDFNCDRNVDASDVTDFLSSFGRSIFNNPCPTCQDSPCPCTPAPVPKTGQTICYDNAGTPINCTGTGQNGDILNGVIWPSPRFTDNSDGTVTDSLTNLIWLKNADCFGTQTWSQALSDCSGLADGSCGLTDGSSAGDWKLPNVRELHSLIDYGATDPALPSGHPFTNVQSFWYWSNTTTELGPVGAFLVKFDGGNVGGGTKTANDSYVWPVREGP